MSDQNIDNPAGGNIDTQVNIGETKGGVNFHVTIGRDFGDYKEHEEKKPEIDQEKKLHSSEKQKADDSGSLPNVREYLIELPENPSLSYNFSPDLIPNCVLQHALNSRILLLDCPDKKLLHAATYAFIEGFEKKETEPFDKKHLDGRSLHENTSLSSEIGWFVRDDIDENQIIVLDITTDDLTLFFLESINDRFVDIDHAKATLIRKNDLLLIKIDSREVPEPILEDLKEYIWKVPFLPYILKNHGYEDLEAIISEQQKQGLWAKKAYRFHHELRGVIRQDTLRAECKRRGKDLTEEEIERRREQEKETMRRILEKEKKPLRRYLIFLVAFFKDISDDDLDRLLLTLIKDYKKLLKEYKKGYKKLLRDCHIQRISSSEEDYIDMLLEFSNLDYRDQAIHYFFLEDFHFSRSQCNILLKHGFLLQKGPSYPSYRSLIGLIGRVSKASSGYGFKLLKYLIAAIVSGETSVDLAIPEYNINEIFAKGLYDSELEYKALIGNNNAQVYVDEATFNIIKRRRTGYSILAEVIQEMAHHDRLAQDLKQFYHFLIANKQHVAAFEVIRILRHSTKVDKIEWIRQLIDNGDTSIKNKAFEYLITFAPPTPLQLKAYLSSIHEWLPTRPDPATYSHANNYALKFILEFSNFTYWKLKLSTDNFGHYPSLYALFALLQESSAATDEWLGKILDWLCHPGIEYAWNEGSEEVALTKKRYYFSIANLLENWHAILHGLTPEPQHPENLELFDRILSYFIPIAMNDRVIYQSLITNFTQKSSYYEQKFRQAIRKEKGSNTPQEQQAAEQSKNEFAARRYLLLNKFIPTFKDKIDKQPV